MSILKLEGVFVLFKKTSWEVSVIFPNNNVHCLNRQKKEVGISYQENWVS